MTIEEYGALSADEQRRAIYENNERTRELVTGDNNRIIGFTYQTLGGFYRAYSFLSGGGVGPFDSRNEATDNVKASAATIAAQPPAIRRALSRLN